MTTIKPLRRRVAAVSAPLLLALSLTACGGGSDASGAPDDASSEDFCAIFLDQSDDLGNSDDSGKQLEAAQDLADSLTEVGTPADFSDEAREGFELFVEAIDDLDEGDIEDFADSEDASDIFDEDDAAKVEAFTTAAVQSCIGGLSDELGDDLGGTGDGGSEDPFGDLESELPDLEPSDLPS